MKDVAQFEQFIAYVRGVLFTFPHVFPRFLHILAICCLLIWTEMLLPTAANFVETCGHSTLHFRGDPKIVCERPQLAEVFGNFWHWLLISFTRIIIHFLNSPEGAPFLECNNYPTTFAERRFELPLICVKKTNDSSSSTPENVYWNIWNAQNVRRLTLHRQRLSWEPCDRGNVAIKSRQTRWDFTHKENRYPQVLQSIDQRPWFKSCPRTYTTFWADSNQMPKPIEKNKWTKDDLDEPCRYTHPSALLSISRCSG